MQFVRYNTSDLYLQFASSNQPSAQYVRIANHFGAAASRVDAARFADGTEIDLSSDAIRLVTIGNDVRNYAAAGYYCNYVNYSDELLWGGGSADELRGMQGNDHLYGYGSTGRAARTFGSAASKPRRRSRGGLEIARRWRHPVRVRLARICGPAAGIRLGSLTSI